MGVGLGQQTLLMVLSTKAHIVSLIFSFLFMLFLAVKGSKQWGYFFSTQSKQEFFEVNVFFFFCIFFFSPKGKIVIIRGWLCKFPNTSPLAGAHVSQQAEPGCLLLGFSLLVFHLMRAVGWILMCPGWLRTSKGNIIPSSKTYEDKDTRVQLNRNINQGILKKHLQLQLKAVL